MIDDIESLIKQLLIWIKGVCVCVCVRARACACARTHMHTFNSLENMTLHTS